jgi:hypothetical protein
VAFDGIDAQADDLDATFIELRLELGHVAELGRADRSEILRCEKITAQESPIHSWNRIRPSVVSASKSGAMSLILTLIVDLQRSLFLVDQKLRISQNPALALWGASYFQCVLQERDELA